jgi:DNA-binding NarL/FixJ family response regulator
MTSLAQQREAHGAGRGQTEWRALIVDDHPLFRAGLRELLSQQSGCLVAGEAATEDEAFERFVAGDVNLVTIDVSLASGNGLNLIARIKKHNPAVFVLVISMYEDRVYADLAVAAGASGYLSKQSSAGEFRSALETIRQGGVYVSPNVAPNSMRQAGGEANTVRALKEQQLSSRELQIFTMIGQGKSTHEIAKELAIAVSTVETYRERLKTKLNLSTGSELTRHALFWMMQNT